jgi:hypothetical protein
MLLLFCATGLCNGTRRTPEDKKRDGGYEETKEDGKIEVKSSADHRTRR